MLVFGATLELFTMHEEFAEELPRQQSYLEFIVNALGWRYMFFLPLAALVSFVLILVLVLRGRGSTLSAALVLLVPLPFLVGILGYVDGLVASLQVIAMSDTAPKPSQLAEGMSMAFVTIWIGMLLSIPSLLLAIGGTFVRSLIGDPSQASPSGPIQATIVESKR
jgi:hypothetical protein